MSNGTSTPIKKEDLLWSSLWGLSRGLVINTFIYPLEVIKIRQQCSQGETKVARIVLDLFRQEGVGAFYRGLAPQLLKSSIKQIWCWPMILEMPNFLRHYPIGNLQTQAITGISIATVDAVISTPLERMKIKSAFKGVSKFNLKSIYADGWHGFSTHWMKLSVSWVTFLTAQKYFRDKSCGSSDSPTPLLQLAKIGVQVALIVSLVTAPLDFANTRRQAQNLSTSHLLSRNNFLKLYRGWPLSALSLIINSIASVVIIDRIGKS